MGHTPYGYRIIQGKAVVDEAQAAQIRVVYTAYLNGRFLRMRQKKLG